MSAEQQAVTSFLKKNANDPESYEPVRWSKPLVWTQEDENKLQVPALLDSSRRMKEKEALMYDLAKNAAERGFPDAKKYSAEWEAFSNKRIAVLKAAKELQEKKDTTAVGKILIHAFRAKNKMGALVLDSAQFVVFKNGQVKVI
ncbi:hypothetical protein [Hymenobacter fodinae]|uniref:Uncharacterized protein n=1 Tax=Hymenobacter fodinae TaxID=2510796 RepID=A0A4Z0P9V5_9BACT|nr:hypothetical protein [Hymenobacter fodinae]TGE08755.1 hypothetical protein EU556_13800 [Hymenobacter fodinae]